MLRDNEISVSTNEIKVGGRVRPKFSAFKTIHNSWACFEGEKDEPYTFLVDKDAVLAEIEKRFPLARDMTEFNQWFKLNEDTLTDQYHEHVSYLQDSSEHKRYMLKNEKCFFEWCEEKHEKETKR